MSLISIAVMTETTIHCTSWLMVLVVVESMGHRMFSDRITESTKFLKMPAASQNLYFHLGMNADDDGVVEAFNVMGLTRSRDEDMKVLIDAGYVKILNEDSVAWLTDWREHNYIRPDRKKDSIYKDLLIRVVPDVELVEPKPRSDLKGGRSTDGPWTDNGPPKISKDKLSKGKVREDKSREEEQAKPARTRFVKPSLDELKAYNEEKQLNVDCERFMDYYEANGWKAGRNPMKDWKAAMRNWARNDQSRKKEEPYYDLPEF